MRNRRVVATVLVVAGLLGVSVSRVSADPLLTLSAPATASLGSGAPGTTISAPIGPVTVTDDRALVSANWTVTAAETDFANGAQTIPATDASYEPGTITTTGTITVTPTSVTLANSAENVVTGSAGVGDNTATWDPTVAVAVPASAVAGTYTGTLTQSVNGATASTTVTFTVTSGALSLSTPVSGNLGSGAPGTTISAAIGPVTVIDDRALASAGWTVTAAETDFADGAQTIPASDASYAPGSITTTGTITATGTNVTLANSAQDVVTGSAGVGDNTATWDPVVSVAVPASAVAGTYTGTLTHSIIGDPSVTLTFTVVRPSITTSQQPATAMAGSSIADKATVSGGDNPTGTVTFNLYDNPNGTGTPLFTDTEPLSGGAATSAGFTATAAGTDYWVATYNGDSNNGTAMSGLADEPVTITPAAATHLTVSVPASVTAGSPFSVTVSAEDQFDNLAPTYRGTVHFTTTDAGSGVVLPADYTFTSGDNGTHTFTNSATLVTAGPQTVTVTDTTNSSVTGSGSLTVTTAAATHLTVSVPASVTAGSPFSVTVSAEDQFDNLAPTYRGTVHFTTTDAGSGVVLPADYTFTSGDNGTHTFTNSATLVTAGPQTVTVTDTTNSSVTGSGSLTVTTAAATHLTVSVPASVTAGSPFSVTVSAEDQFDNLAPTYRETVHFTTTDAGSGVVLPADYTFTSGDNGTHTFTNSATLVTAGPQTVTVTDTTNSSVTGSGTVTVTAAAPTIATTQQPTTAPVGSSVADKATVTGGGNPTGTVTFNLFNNPNGTGTPLFTDTEPLSGGSATSAGYTAMAAGTDYWVATYNGDANNNSVTSGTTPEPVLITAPAAIPPGPPRPQRPPRGRCRLSLIPTSATPMGQ